jgi:hypothetical protein
MDLHIDIIDKTPHDTKGIIKYVIRWFKSVNKTSRIHELYSFNHYEHLCDVMLCVGQRRYILLDENCRPTNTDKRKEQIQVKDLRRIFLNVNNVGVDFDNNYKSDDPAMQYFYV